MSETSDDPSDISAAELRRRLAALTPIVPLTADELLTVREVLQEWKFQQMLRQERTLEAEAKRARWPLIGIVVSVSTSVLLWLATFLASHWPFHDAPQPRAPEPPAATSPK